MRLFFIIILIQNYFIARLNFQLLSFQYDLSNKISTILSKLMEEESQRKL